MIGNLFPAEAVGFAADSDTWEEVDDDTGRLCRCELRPDATPDPMRIQTVDVELPTGRRGL